MDQTNIKIMFDILTNQINHQKGIFFSEKKKRKHSK